MKPAHNPSRQNNKGAVTVELAIILPFLVLLLAGIIDFGILIREHQLLQNAAREGARFSSLEQNQIAVQGTTAAQNAVKDAIKDRVLQYIAAETSTVPQADVSVTISQTESVDLGDGTSISVSKVNVSYTHSTLLVASGWKFGATTLRATAIFPNLY